ncbi:protein IWS1-like protein [Senna tora]|uniref:Protein IWS1-like protein n=1 Tax=Senna tora TaxID=362788 RepID=A0A834XE39_9FABA|nr:protein IWS1-like protein [Senna tora]
MSFLESLEVKGCDGLKHIVTNEGDNAHDHMTYSSIFPKLKEISIEDCSFLEYIFPASHCRSFNNLEFVRIIGVNKLRYVFDDVPNMVSIGTQNYNFRALSLEYFVCSPSLVGAFQGIDFQTNIPPTSSTKMDDDDEHSEELYQEIFEYIGNLAPETNSQLQEGPKTQATLRKNKLFPSQSKKEAIENELAIQMKNNNTPNLTMSTKGSTNDILAMETPSSSSYMFYCDSLNKKVSSGEGTSSSTHSEPEIASLGPLTSTKEFHEKESMGDQELHLEKNTEESTGEGPSSEKYIKPTSSTYSETKILHKRQLSSTKGQIMVNETMTYLDEKVRVDHINSQQFEDDDLIRLLRTIDAGTTNIGVHKTYVSNIASLEDDNKVAKTFSDVEESLKMDVNEIANSEEKSIRLENDLKFLSTHYSRDGAPSLILKDKINSMLQETKHIKG